MGVGDVIEVVDNRVEHYQLTFGPVPTDLQYFSLSTTCVRVNQSEGPFPALSSSFTII